MKPTLVEHFVGFLLKWVVLTAEDEMMVVIVLLSMCATLTHAADAMAAIPLQTWGVAAAAAAGVEYVLPNRVGLAVAVLVEPRPHCTQVNSHTMFPHTIFPH